MITKSELIIKLWELVNKYPRILDAAEVINVTPSYLSQALNHGIIGPAIYEGLGYRKVTLYEKVEVPE